MRTPIVSSSCIWGVSRMQLRTRIAVPKMGAGVDFEELAPNHPDLMRPKGVVVNVRGKAPDKDVRWVLRR
jgi:hypothetical protein